MYGGNSSIIKFWLQYLRSSTFICGSKLTRIQKAGCHTAALMGCGGRVIEGTNRDWNQFDINPEYAEVRREKQKCSANLCGLTITRIIYFNSHPRPRQQSQTPEATAHTHHFPIHTLRMRTHTRFAAPGMGGRTSVGMAAQVSGERRAAEK